MTHSAWRSGTPTPASRSRSSADARSNRPAHSPRSKAPAHSTRSSGIVSSRHIPPMTRYGPATSTTSSASSTVPPPPTTPANSAPPHGQCAPPTGSSPRATSLAATSPTPSGKRSSAPPRHTSKPAHHTWQAPHDTVRSTRTHTTCASPSPTSRPSVCSDDDPITRGRDQGPRHRCAGIPSNSRVRGSRDSRRAPVQAYREGWRSSISPQHYEKRRKALDSSEGSIATSEAISRRERRCSCRLQEFYLYYDI